MLLAGDVHVEGDRDGQEPDGRARVLQGSVCGARCGEGCEGREGERQNTGSDRSRLQRGSGVLQGFEPRISWGTSLGFRLAKVAVHVLSPCLGWV